MFREWNFYVSSADLRKAQLRHFFFKSKPTNVLGKFAQMKAKGDYFVTVIEDTRKQLIIGAGWFFN